MSGKPIMFKGSVGGFSIGRALGKDATGTVSGRVVIEGNALEFPFNRLTQLKRDGQLVQVTLEPLQMVIPGTEEGDESEGAE